MNETSLLRAVIALCGKYNVKYFHDYDSLLNPPGFPDLVLVGKKRCVFVELKAQHGQMSGDQVSWSWKLKAAGESWYLWRPSDLASGHIEEFLADL